MTEHNLFQEVQEDLERQKLEALWKQYGKWIVAAALAIVLGTAVSSAYRSHKLQKDQTMTSGLIAAVEGGGDLNQSIDKLLKFAGEGAGSNQAAFATLQAGQLALQQEDAEKAIALFDRVASDGEADEAYRQLGELMSVRTALDTGDPAKLFQRLQPLTDEGVAWRFAAMEAQGALALRMGDKDKARRLFTSLSQDARVPKAMAGRAADILRGMD